MKLTRVWSCLLETCLVLSVSVLADLDGSWKSSERDNILGLGMNGDIFAPKMESDLLKEDEKQDDADQRAAFPVMDIFKEHPYFTADDLKDRVEDDYSDKIGIRKAVDQALKKLHKKKEQATATPFVKKPHVVTAKELIDEVVKQELSSHAGLNTAGGNGEKSAASSSEEVKSKLHEKLDEISNLESKLFDLIRDVKGYLVTKKNTAEDDSTNNLPGKIDNLSLDGLITKRSEIPFNIHHYRNNVSLVQEFVREALKDDFDASDFYNEDADSENEDRKGAKQGDTRDLLGKEAMEYALLKQAIPGEIEDIPVSNLEREIDEDDSVASDNGITRDALVDSPFSSLDYKKVTGKRSRHYVS